MTCDPDSGEEHRDRIRVGGPVDETSATLRILGDDLDPDEITGILRFPPTAARRKGNIRIGKVTKNQYKRGQANGILSLPVGRAILTITSSGFSMRCVPSRNPGIRSTNDTIWIPHIHRIFQGAYLQARVERRSRRTCEKRSNSTLRDFGKRGSQFPCHLWRRRSAKYSRTRRRTPTRYPPRVERSGMTRAVHQNPQAGSR